MLENELEAKTKEMAELKVAQSEEPEIARLRVFHELSVSIWTILTSCSANASGFVVYSCK